MGVFIAAKDRSPFYANDNETFAAFLLDVRGQAAALAGLPFDANPYPIPSFEAACWSAGWLEGSCELIFGRAPMETHRATAMESVAL